VIDSAEDDSFVALRELRQPFPRPHHDGAQVQLPHERPAGRGGADGSRWCSNGEIAVTLDIDKSKVAKIGARVRRQGHVGRPSSTGRPPILNRRCLQRLKRLVRSGRYSSLSELTSEWNSGGYKQVSTKTLRRCIRKLGFSSLKPVTKPYF